MKIINLDLAEKSYKIMVGADIFQKQIREFLDKNKYSKIVILCDENVNKFYNKLISQTLPNSNLIIINQGESSKSFKNFNQICEKILKIGIDRKSLIVAIGGGVVGDLAGFCASVLLRGIDFIQIPTTLLSMVDSSVGGKTAINSRYGKNLIGSFYQPKLVICDINFLESLNQREFKSGYGEVVKYGLIYDAEFFKYLQENLAKIFSKDNETLINIVEKSCLIKAEIVSKDEKENNIRALLNFGHTFGHAIETEAKYSSAILHGEAIALGMAMASKLSKDLNFIDQFNYDQIIFHLQKSGFELDLKNFGINFKLKNLIRNLYKDKKTQNNQLNFILLNNIGCGQIFNKIDKKF
ncbi:MAG: 3-dehydroquinate synthase, partial [Alphaproteobacteria bacterium]